MLCWLWLGSLAVAVLRLSGIARIEWIPEYGTAFVFLTAVTLPMFLLDLLNERRGEEYVFEGLPAMKRVAVAMSLMAAVLIFAGSSANAFIYFQF